MVVVATDTKRTRSRYGVNPCYAEGTPSASRVASSASCAFNGLFPRARLCVYYNKVLLRLIFMRVKGFEPMDCAQWLHTIKEDSYTRSNEGERALV